MKKDKKELRTEIINNEIVTENPCRSLDIH